MARVYSLSCRAMCMASGRGWGWAGRGRKQEAKQGQRVAAGSASSQANVSVRGCHRARLRARVRAPSRSRSHSHAHPRACSRACSHLEHKLDARLGVVGIDVSAGGGYLPVKVAREAVLLHFARAELWEAVRDAARNGLGLVELRVGRACFEEGMPGLCG